MHSPSLYEHSTKSQGESTTGNPSGKLQTNDMTEFNNNNDDDDDDDDDLEVAFPQSGSSST